MSAGQELRERLARGEKLVSIGVWDVLSAKVVEKAGVDLLALQSFQYAAGWGVPDVGLRTASDLLEITFKMAGEVKTPILIDLEGGFGGPGHAAYWAREFERAGAAAVHIDDEGTAHSCPWLPGAKDVVDFRPAEATAEAIAAMAEACGEGLVIIARCNSVVDAQNYDAQASEAEEMRRLRLYREAGADVIYAPKCATMSNNLSLLRRFADELGAPLMVQCNPPGYISHYVRKDSPDGRSIADRTFAELFAAGASIVSSPQLYPVAYRALLEVVQEIVAQGRLEPAREKMLSFQEMLGFTGYDRFALRVRERLRQA